MSVPWLELNEDVKKCLLSCFRRESKQNMSSQEVSNSIYGFCKMKVSWSNHLLNDDRLCIQKALLRVKDDMNSQEVANNIYR